MPFNPIPAIHLITALHNDVRASYVSVKADSSSQYARRVFVRNVFAWIEAWLFIARQVLLEEPSLQLHPLSAHERAVLREVS